MTMILAVLSSKSRASVKLFELGVRTACDLFLGV